jgi:O-acetylserine/cysteine efflux transporter
MTTARRSAVAALTAAGLLWGTTVPLSKVSLEWLPPAWLTLVRFTVAAAILLVAARSRVRAAFTPAILVSGAIGYGGTVLLQNAGITRTSVSHAALLIGTTPVLVAVIAALWQRSVARPVAWVGFAVSLAGVGLIAGGGGGGATFGGDALVLASLVLSAAFTVAQTRLLRGQDPVAVTAMQFLAAAVAVAPVAVLSGGVPAVSGGAGVLLATMGLATVGTTLPFTLFAYGQLRLPAEVAGAFLNIEPLVGAVLGVVAFGDPAGPAQLAGGVAILGGIAMSSVPLSAFGRRLRLSRAADAVAAAEPAAGLAEVPALAPTDRAARAVPTLAPAPAADSGGLPPEDTELHDWLGLGSAAGDAATEPDHPRALASGAGQQRRPPDPGGRRRLTSRRLAGGPLAGRGQTGRGLAGRGLTGRGLAGRRLVASRRAAAPPVGGRHAPGSRVRPAARQARQRRPALPAAHRGARPHTARRARG